MFFGKSFGESYSAEIRNDPHDDEISPPPDDDKENRPCIAPCQLVYTYTHLHKCTHTPKHTHII